MMWLLSELAMCPNSECTLGYMGLCRILCDTHVPCLQAKDHFQIESYAHNFLFNIFIRLLLPSLIVTSSQVRVGMPLPLLSCYLWLGARRPTTQSYDSGVVSWYYSGWPLRLHRGNSASAYLPWETQWPKCCLYKLPTTLQHPLQKQVTSSRELHSMRDFLQACFLSDFW